MKRVLAALIAVVALLGSVVVAQAATLTLDAGTLQTLHVTQSPQIPDEPEPELAKIILDARVWNPGGQEQTDRRRTTSYEVAASELYEVRWDEAGIPVVSCADKDVDLDGWTDVFALGGTSHEFTAIAGAEHRFVMCLRGQPGQSNPEALRLKNAEAAP